MRVLNPGFSAVGDLSKGNSIVGTTIKNVLSDNNSSPLKNDSEKVTPSIRITRNRSRGESFSAFEPYPLRKKIISEDTPNLFKILSDASD
jgi:hypothetical protein